MKTNMKRKKRETVSGEELGSVRVESEEETLSLSPQTGAVTLSTFGGATCILWDIYGRPAPPGCNKSAAPEPACRKLSGAPEASPVKMFYSKVVQGETLTTTRGIL